MVTTRSLVCALLHFELDLMPSAIGTSSKRWLLPDHSEGSVNSVDTTKLRPVPDPGHGECARLVTTNKSGRREGEYSRAN